RLMELRRANIERQKGPEKSLEESYDLSTLNFIFTAKFMESQKFSTAIVSELTLAPPCLKSTLSTSWKNAGV
ncbi:hypothetical protein BGZ65_005220, partial [Modicella reniformis]